MNHTHIALIALLLPISGYSQDLSALRLAKVKELRDLAREIREVSYSTLTCDIRSQVTEIMLKRATTLATYKNMSKETIKALLDKDAKEYGTQLYSLIFNSKDIPQNFYDELFLEDGTFNFLKIIHLEGAVECFYAVNLMHRFSRCAQELLEIQKKIKEDSHA